MIVKSGSYNCFGWLTGRAGEWSAEEAERESRTLPFGPPLAPLPPRSLPFDGSFIGDDRPDPPPVAGAGEPNSLSLTSAYLRCFSSRSCCALLCRSPMVRSRSFRASSSLSSSSSCKDMPLTPDSIFARGATAGFGLRLRTLSAGLYSDLRGTSLRASTKWKVSGFSAESQSCLLASACLALRSARVILMGDASWTGPDVWRFCLNSNQSFVVLNVSQSLLTSATDS